jgi:hypothetical protein
VPGHRLSWSTAASPRPHSTRRLVEAAALQAGAPTVPSGGPFPRPPRPPILARDLITAPSPCRAARRREAPSISILIAWYRCRDRQTEASFNDLSMERSAPPPTHARTQHASPCSDGVLILHTAHFSHASREACFHTQAEKPVFTRKQRSGCVCSDMD